MGGKLPSQGLLDASVPSPLLIHIGFEGLKYLKYLKYLCSSAAARPVPSAGGAWGSRALPRGYRPSHSRGTPERDVRRTAALGGGWVVG